MISNVLEQLCPTRGSRAAYGPGEGFARPGLGFRCSKSILHTDNLSPYFDNREFEIFDAGVLSATFSRLLPLQLGFERFQYNRLS